MGDAASFGAMVGLGETYLPAFAGIGASLSATPAQMQQTLSAYLFGFAAMNLFHGSLADAYGRRPVVLAGLASSTALTLLVLPTIYAWLEERRAVAG